MDLKQVVKRLNEYANCKIALVSWDNVGLLVEPTKPLIVKKAFVTNDLTEPVLEEAIAKGANLIISYHPPIFTGLKRLTNAEWKQRSIVKCIEQGIAVYSPHTSWDNINYGINDWILEAFDVATVKPIEDSKTLGHPCGFSKSASFITSVELKDKLVEASKSSSNLKFVEAMQVSGSATNIQLEFVGSPRGIAELMALIKDKCGESSDAVFGTLRVNSLEIPIFKDIGLGRIATLKEPIKISEVIARTKKQLNMKVFRFAIGNGKTQDSLVSSVAVGAGSGAKLLNNQDVDFLITGEFPHHDILHEVHRGVSLIVTDHTNTERGYFASFKTRFEKLLEKNGESCEIILSEVDRDPLEYI